MNPSMNQSVNDNDVCRTALATPGLLKTPWSNARSKALSLKTIAKMVNFLQTFKELFNKSEEFFLV